MKFNGVKDKWLILSGDTKNSVLADKVKWKYCIFNDGYCFVK